MVSVIFVIAIIAALIGLLIYCRRNTQRNPVQTQRHTTGLICLKRIFNFDSNAVLICYIVLCSPIESFDGYEIVALAVSEGKYHVLLSLPSLVQLYTVTPFLLPHFIYVPQILQTNESTVFTINHGIVACVLVSFFTIQITLQYFTLLIKYLNFHHIKHSN